MTRHKVVTNQLNGMIEILGDRPLEKSWKEILQEAIDLIESAQETELLFKLQLRFDKQYYLDNYTPQQWFNWIASGCKKYMVKPEGVNAACEWVNCAHGMGLAGRGRCSARGTWWRKNCKSFEKMELTND